MSKVNKRKHRIYMALIEENIKIPEDRLDAFLDKLIRACVISQAKDEELKTVKLKKAQVYSETNRKRLRLF